MRLHFTFLFPEDLSAVAVFASHKLKFGLHKVPCLLDVHRDLADILVISIREEALDQLQVLHGVVKVLVTFLARLPIMLILNKRNREGVKSALIDVCHVQDNT
jgi:hypothetical protein